MREIIFESIIKASHSADFLVADLQAAYGNSDAVLALALEPLITTSVELKRQLEVLQSALEAAK